MISESEIFHKIEMSASIRKINQSPENDPHLCYKCAEARKKASLKFRNRGQSIICVKNSFTNVSIIFELLTDKNGNYGDLARLMKSCFQNFDNLQKFSFQSFSQ